LSARTTRTNCGPIAFVVTHFDLAIIGTGSGNALVTSDFDGKRVAVIESGTFAAPA